MTSSKEIIERKCCFYASDFHLEMTIVPYINRKLAESKNIVIITQNKLKDSVKILISKMNIKNKEEILALDWNNSSSNQIEGKDDLVIITNGSKQFIEEKNLEIKEKIEKTPVEIINCYSFEEIKDEIVELRAAHTAVLNNLQKDY